MTTQELIVHLRELRDNYEALSRKLAGEVPEFKAVARDADYLFNGTNQSTLQNILDLVRRCEDQIDDMVRNLHRTIIDLEDYEIANV